MDLCILVFMGVIQGQCPGDYLEIGNPKCLCLQTLASPATMPSSIVYTSEGSSQIFTRTSEGSCPFGTTGYTIQNCNGSTKSPISNATITGFSEPCTYSAGILPVHIVDFGINLENTGFMIYWTVAEESGVDLYKIQYSRDGIHFEDIATTPARYEGGGGVYEYESNHHGEGQHYFRLMVVELDGSISLSDIRDVRLDFKEAVVAFPTQARAVVSVQWNPNQMEVEHIAVFSAYGQMMWSSVSIEQSMAQIELEDFPSGHYFIVLLTKGDGEEILRFAKL